MVLDITYGRLLHRQPQDEFTQHRYVHKIIGLSGVAKIRNFPSSENLFMNRLGGDEGRRRGTVLNYMVSEFLRLHTTDTTHL